MNQLKSMSSVNKSKNLVKIKSEQFLYLGKWIDKNGFRAFVYDKKGDQKLANSYDEYEQLISSGIWYATREDANQKRKYKDAAISNG